MGLFKNLYKFNNKIALVNDKNQKLTYKDLLFEVNKISKIIKKRSLVIIISENSLGSILAYIFCILKKHPVIIIDSKTPSIKIKEIFKIYQPKFVFSSKMNSKIIKNYCSIEYNFFSQILYKNKKHKKILINKNLSVLISTSGSMGGLKLAKLSYTNLYFNTYSILKYLKINSGDSAITNLPISYSYMLSIINTHLEVGGKIVVSQFSIIQKQFWNIFNLNKVTSFNGVPHTYEILDKIGIHRLKNKYIKYFTHAGGKLDVFTLKKLVNFSYKEKIKFISMYGQTEASPRISYLNPKFLNKKTGSIGKAIPGNKIYLIDKNKKKINTPFVVGELICEGKNVFMGYSNEYSDLKKGSISNKLMTGDLAYFDNDNFFYITGRTSKIVKIFGNRVDLEFLENQLKNKKYIVSCISDEKKIYLFYEKPYKKKKLLIYTQKITNVSVRYLETIKLKSFPRTLNNKISYENLREKINVKL